MGPAPSLPDRIYACVTVRRQPIGVVVQVRYDEAPLGVRLHSGARDAAVRLLMSRSDGEVLERTRSCRFGLADLPIAQALAEELRHRLLQIARRPLSGRQVEQVLRINSEERRQWTREGRLPARGQSRMRRGPNKITLRTYDPELIEALADTPCEIARWRGARRRAL